MIRQDAKLISDRKKEKVKVMLSLIAGTEQ